MPLRVHRSFAGLLFLVFLAGCGGPPDQELCGAVVAALPLVYLITVGILSLLERIRRAPDAAPRSIGRELLVTAGGIAAISALVVTFGYPDAYRPDMRMDVLTLAAFGAVALGVSLVLSRSLRTASYAVRTLRAAQLGAALGLPCLLLWPLGASKAAELYIHVMLPAAMLSAIYTPVVLLWLLVEAIVRREPRKD